jgi:hypothetical protein
VERRGQGGPQTSVRKLHQEEYEKAKQAEQLAKQEEVRASRNAVFNVPVDGVLSQGEKRADSRGISQSQAERTGDGMLARVAYHRALDIGAHPSDLTDYGMQAIVDRYLADKPGEAKALERYNRALEEANRVKDVESLLAQAMTDRMFAS